MAAKIFLGINAALFIVYGLMCLASPSVAADQAGIQMTTGDASAEMRAMYGGLQTALGMLALGGALRVELRRAVLFMFVFLYFGLATGRMIGLLADSGVGQYTFGALGFEVLFGVACAVLLARTDATGGTFEALSTGS